MFMAILLLALIIDILLGEPPNKYHPVAWLGSFINKIAPMFKAKLIFSERLGGALLAIVSILIFTTPFYLILELSAVNLVAYLLSSAMLLKFTFAIRCMSKYAKSIASAITDNRLLEARKLTSLIVRRDVSEFDEKLLASATIESIAESTVDGATSPLFFYSLFGVVGAAVFRAINTLDSIVGYRDQYHINLGWFSAKLDTFANFITARLSALLMALSAFLLGLNWRASLRVALRDHSSTASLNAGWVMSAMAGALEVQLRKPGHYELASEYQLPSVHHVLRALKVMYLTVALFVGFVCAPLSLTLTYLWGQWGA